MFILSQFYRRVHKNTEKGPRSPAILPIIPCILLRSESLYRHFLLFLPLGIQRYRCAVG